MRTVLLSCAVAAALALAGPAQGATITFDSLGGGNLTPYTGHNEGTFTVTPTSGGWVEGHLFGHPTPSIVGDNGIATSTITVTENSTGFFTFQGVDLADANVGAPKVTYLFEGLLQNAPVFTTPGGPLSPVVAFLTVPSASGAVIDELRISLTTTDTLWPFNVDNIDVTTASNPVPEPVTMALVGLATCGLGGYVRRRRMA